MEAHNDQWEAGYSAPGGYAVCPDCAKDSALADLIEANGDAEECSFCGSRGKRIAADTEIVLQRIGSQLLIEWSRAEELLYHDDEADSGYAGPDYEIRDVLELEGVEFGNERFEEFVLDAFRETQFTPSGVYATTQGEALRFGWDDLVRTVKHQQRFFFVLAPNDRSADGVGIPVPRGLELLSELSRLIREYDLLRELPAGTALFRARTHSVRKRYTGAKELGSPPPSAASQSRMSPAGIPMLYTADDPDTAIAEIVGARPTLRKGVTIAEFEPTEPMQVVDFSRLPEFPSVFEDSPDVPRIRQELGFLHGMRRDVGLEVKLDGREHVDYVPTQVVCEYLRYQLPVQLGSPVHGLAWESTRVSGSLNIVLFLDQARCVEVGERPAMAEGPLVELVRHERRRLQ